MKNLNANQKQSWSVKLFLPTKNLSAIMLSLVLTMMGYTHAQMNKAYELANEMVRGKLYRENQDNIRILDGLKDHDVIVLQSLKIPFISIGQYDLLNVKLEPHQTIFVNCASSFPSEAARKLATFVSEGGQLITTDWALKHVIEVAFPNTIAHNNKTTGDEVVRIEVVDKKDSLLTGFLDEKSAPVWWLEGSSYPIKILNKEKVKTLIRSKELKERHGEEPVVVRFEHGKGTVYHMISHFYLQRSETRNGNQKVAAAEYFKDKNATAAEIKKAEASGVSYVEIQSANTSADFVSRIIIMQKRKK
jgi:hypothetical protein